MILTVKNKLMNRPFLYFFWTCFFFTVFATLFIQFILLPYVLPHLHAGHGLLLGGDWIGFHEFAVAQAQDIQRFGWGSWRLSPSGQPQSGIASLFYAVIAAEPWALIPLNSALHATAASLLASIIFMIAGSVRIAILAALPFLLFPSAATWYSQLHKEGFFIVGYLLCLYGWVRIGQTIALFENTRSCLMSILCIFVGIFVIGIVRDFGVKLLVVMSIIFASALTARLLAARSLQSARNTILSIFVLLSIPSFAGVFSSNHYFDAAQINAYRESRPHAGTSQVALPPLIKTWTNPLHLPKVLDEQFAAVSQLRRDYLSSSPSAKSEIDPDARFDNAEDIFLYIPRAIQVGLFAPFPEDWFADGSLAVTSVMRRVTGAEMLVTYLGLCFLPYFLMRRRLSLNAWLFFGVNLLFVLLYTYVIPNIGTLYRMRYGFLMSLVAMGIAGLAMVVEEARAK